MNNNKNEILEIAEILLEASTNNSNAYKEFDTDTVFKYGCDRLNGASVLCEKGYVKNKPMPFSKFCEYSIADIAKYGTAFPHCEVCHFTENCEKESTVCEQRKQWVLIKNIIDILENFNGNGDNTYAIKLLKRHFCYMD